VCNRYSKAEKTARVESVRFGQIEFESVPRYNIAPTQTAPVVAVENGRLVHKDLTWGWDTKAGLLMNARSETASQKLFKRAWAESRCIVPADGFFEWRNAASGKQGYRFFLPASPLFWFAGLMDKNCFLILTGPANGLIRSIHDRAPIVLNEWAIDWWLGNDDVMNPWGPNARAVNSAAWNCYPVTRKMNSSSFEDPSAIAPASIDPELFPQPIDNPVNHWHDFSNPPPIGRLRLLFANNDTIEASWDGASYFPSIRSDPPIRWSLDTHRALTAPSDPNV
jgi:putative SOS response-associated peptidase YedK